MTDAPNSDLDQLAEALGIEPGYSDVWGTYRRISDDAKARLAAALGYPAHTASDTADSLRRVRERGWSRLVPTVMVVTEGEPIVVPVNLPKGVSGEVMWTLWPESGAERYESSVVTMLPLVAAGSADGRVVVRRNLDLGYTVEPGYHQLTVAIADAGLSEEMTLIVAPRRCPSPATLIGDRRVWGLAAQLYGLRGEDDWGIGDFGHLGRLAEVAKGLGADLIGLNPLHALFPADPGHDSPYSPSSRGFLNVLHIDPMAVPEYATCAAARALVDGGDFQARLAGARSAELVDYPAVSALKLPVLELLYAQFESDGGATERAAAFDAFLKEMGEPLRRHTLFEALHEHHYRRDPGLWHWRNWPEEHRDIASPAVRAFAAEHAGRVRFFAWLQWEADRQLAAAAGRAKAAGMGVGFYRDLAVGANSGGSAAWADPGALVPGASVGAPPDLLNMKGQNWGLTPLSPLGLVDRAYAPFIEAVRANMRHAGALRIDHVMGLMHMFWIPEGGDEGAYVTYPLADLVRIIALEATRAGCLVIGEDLGTVPEGFRPLMEDAGVLSYRVLYFERRGDGGDFLPADAYPDNALVAATTHDLPTLRGFWTDNDVKWRRELGLYPNDQMAEKDVWDHGVDRWRLLRALNDAGLKPAAYPTEEGNQPWTPELTAAIYRFLSDSPGRLLMVAAEDVFDDPEQPNLPGTTTEHPNWRRRWPISVEALASHPGAARISAACAGRRG